MKFAKYLFISTLILTVFAPSSLRAQELIQDKVEIVKAEVVDVLSQEKKNVPGTGVQSIYQIITAKILEGDENGKVVTIENGVFA